MTEKPLSNEDFQLISHMKPKSTVAEAYKALRTNIQFAAKKRAIKTLLITSTGPKEGKSTTAINLGITIAQAGHKVLLVDTDLRRPVFHKILKVDNTIGITNILESEGELPQAVKSTHIEGLYVLPRGKSTQNPSELLGTKGMEELIDDMKHRYDMVIFDSSPIISVTDPVVLSSRIDGVILIVQTRKFSREIVLNAKRQLAKVNANILGVVINNIDVDKEHYYYRYYNYYYPHY